MLHAVWKNQSKHRMLDNQIQILQFLEAQHLDVDEGIQINIDRYWLITNLLAHTRHTDFDLAVCQLRGMLFCRSPGFQLRCLREATKTLFQILGEGNASADDFLPLFIYCALKTNSPHLGIVTDYINKYRNPKELVMG